MTIDISPDFRSRLLANAESEGMSIDAFLEFLIEEREELAAAIERVQAQHPPLSREDVKAKVERGFLESQRGEVVDGDTFTFGLLSGIEEIEPQRHLG